MTYAGVIIQLYKWDNDFQFSMEQIILEPVSKLKPKTLDA